MSPRTKQQFESIREEKRTIILDTALGLFADRGYHNTPISQIAKRARISQGLIYNYFRNKEDLLRALMIGVWEKMAEKYLHVVPGQAYTRKDVEKFISDGITIVKENPDYWKLYCSVMIQPAVVKLVLDELMEKGKPYILAMNRYFKQRGFKNPTAMTRYFSAVMDGIQMHIMLDPKNFPANEAKKLLIKQFT